MPEPTTPTGAMPAAGGATPPQTPVTAPADPPATGDDALGEPGKRAIQAERARATAAERERDDFKQRLETLETAGKSEHEKAVLQAKRDGEAEATARLEPMIRRTRVELALASAGVSAKLVPLVARADEFSSLKVENGEVKGLEAAVATVKTANPDWFGQPGRPTGSPDFGAGSGAPKEPSMNELLRAAAGRT